MSQQSEVTIKDDGIYQDGVPAMITVGRGKYTREPLTDFELEKCKKMVANGATPEAAMKTRLNLRRKRRVDKIEDPNGQRD